MNTGTVIVLLIVIGVVAAVVAGIIKNKKSGKAMCGGDCSKCHGCAHGEK